MSSTQRRRRRRRGRERRDRRWLLLLLVLLLLLPLGAVWWLLIPGKLGADGALAAAPIRLDLIPLAGGDIARKRGSVPDVMRFLAALEPHAGTSPQLSEPAPGADFGGPAVPSGAASDGLQPGGMPAALPFAGDTPPDIAPVLPGDSVPTAGIGPIPNPKPIIPPAPPPVAPPPTIDPPTILPPPVLPPPVFPPVGPVPPKAAPSPGPHSTVTPPVPPSSGNSPGPGNPTTSPGNPASTPGGPTDSPGDPTTAPGGDPPSWPADSPNWPDAPPDTPGDRSIVGGGRPQPGDPVAVPEPASLVLLGAGLFLLMLLRRRVGAHERAS